MAWVGGEGDQRDDRRKIVDELCSTAAAPGRGVSPDPQIVADEIVRIVDLPPGARPRRAIADGSDYGAEILNGAAEQLRLRLARRMNITGLLAPNDRWWV